MQHLVKKDLWLALSLMLLGSYCFVQSMGFDTSSRSYPLLLASIIMLIALQIGWKSLKAFVQSQDDISTLMHQIKSPLVSVAIICLWAGLLSVGVGYLPASFIMLMLMLLTFGEKHVIKTSVISLVTVALVFTLFYVIFGIPLPVNSLTHTLLS